MSILVALFLLFAQPARAQACVCSRNITLPSGAVSRPWSGAFTIEYGASLAGNLDRWKGFSVRDLHGDSMAGMYMPPHFSQTGTLTGALGLPAGFSASVSLPYVDVHHVHPSGMEGDVDSSSLADASLSGQWGHKSQGGKVFYGAKAGLTFPTGEVIEDTPVRAGRGVMGAVGGLNLGWKISPKVAMAGMVSGAGGFGPDESGYTVGPSGSLGAGGRWSPRENGKANFGLFLMERWTGKDKKDALVYENTGFLTTDLLISTSLTFWEKALRSASLTLTGQAPLVQTVGDPMYIENFGGSLSLSVVAF